MIEGTSQCVRFSRVGSSRKRPGTPTERAFSESDPGCQRPNSARMDTHQIIDLRVEESASRAPAGSRVSHIGPGGVVLDEANEACDESIQIVSTHQQIRFSVDNLSVGPRAVVATRGRPVAIASAGAKTRLFSIRRCRSKFAV